MTNNTKSGSAAIFRPGNVANGNGSHSFHPAPPLLQLQQQQQLRTAGIPSNSVFSLSAAAPIFSVPNQNVLNASAFNPNVHLQGAVRSFNGNIGGGATISLNPPVYANNSNTVSLNAGNFRGDANGYASHVLLSHYQNGTLPTQTTWRHDYPAARLLPGPDNTPNGPPTNHNGGSSSGPKLGLFFAQQSQQNAAAKVHPAAVTSSSSADAPPRSTLPTAVIRSDVLTPLKAPAPQDEVTSTVRLHDFAAPTERVLKRPKDVLLHLFQGRPVLETPTGQMPTEEHLAFIRSYFKDQKDSLDLDGILGDVKKPGENSVNPPSDLKTRRCHVCRVEKEPSSFSSFTAVRCNACARPAAVAAAPPSVLPQVSESSQSRMLDSVPSQHRRGRKRTAEVALDTTAETAHHGPAAPSAVVIPVKGKKRGPKPKRPCPTESGDLEKPVGSVERESQFVASTSRADIMTPVGNAHPNTISGPDEEVMRAAQMILLLRQKSKIREWMPADVETFAGSVHGMAAWGEAFRSHGVTGLQLWKWAGFDGASRPLKNIATDLTKETGIKNIPACLAIKLWSLLKIAADEVVDSDKLLQWV